MQPIIKKENILFDVDAKDKADMIEQMVEAFSKEGYLSDKEQFPSSLTVIIMIKSTDSSSFHAIGFFSFATQSPASITPLLFPCGIPIPNPIYVGNTSSLAKRSL